MKTLHLIVHERNIRKVRNDLEREYGDNEGHTAKADAVLKRINEVKKANPDRIIEFRGFDFIGQVEQCRHADLVVLYGGSRYCCLMDMSNALQQDGLYFAWDIEGTV